MNNEQRQLLADEINSLERYIEELEEGNASDQKRLERRQAKLHEAKNRRAKLQEGVDWL